MENWKTLICLARWAVSAKADLNEGGLSLFLPTAGTSRRGAPFRGWSIGR
jgi:hypothetical protein